jgi:hypothetical protein
MERVMSDLKPCPFGKDHRLRVESETFNLPLSMTTVGYRVRCGSNPCQATTRWHDSERAAIHFWNTRPLEDAKDAEIARLKERVEAAKSVLLDDGQVDGGHHKAWVIDQALRALTADEYHKVIGEWCEGYMWDVGVSP